MEAVWLVEVSWQRDSELSELGERARNLYFTIVRDYGGTLTPEGYAAFTRYRLAEICAQVLRWRLGAMPTVSLAFG